jgi:hypothetical protein
MTPAAVRRAECQPQKLSYNTSVSLTWRSENGDGGPANEIRHPSSQIVQETQALVQALGTVLAGQVLTRQPPAPPAPPAVLDDETPVYRKMLAAALLAALIVAGLIGLAMLS